MKYKTLLLALLSLTTIVMQPSAQDMPENTELIFPAEMVGPSASNTGEVHLSVLKFSGNSMITNFCFSPGSRNYWHSHPNAEQTLLVLDGEGFYQEEGLEKQVIKKGDVIVTKANVCHWNGATPDKPLICMTVTDRSDDRHVIQVRPVTDEEYGTAGGTDGRHDTILLTPSTELYPLPTDHNGIWPWTHPWATGDQQTLGIPRSYLPGHRKRAQLSMSDHSSY